MAAQIKLKRLSDTAVIPQRGSAFSAGYDLSADLRESITLSPGETRLIETGLIIVIPDGYFGGIYARSGLAAKEGLRPANCVGVIDSDYRGHVMVALHNDSDTDRVIVPGEKIAQLIIQPHLSADFCETGDIDHTDRGAGGFGSTGKI